MKQFFSCPFPDHVKEDISTSVFWVGLSFRHCGFHKLYYLLVRATSRHTTDFQVLANLSIHYFIV